MFLTFTLKESDCDVGPVHSEKMNAYQRRKGEKDVVMGLFSF